MASMLSSFSSPRVRVVATFDELVATPCEDGVNALCLPRSLVGDFAEVVAALPPGKGIVGLDEEELMALPLSAAGRQAVEAMLEDRRRLEALGLLPELNAIHGYVREL